MRSVLNTLPGKDGNTAASASGLDLEKNVSLIQKRCAYKN